MGWEAKCTARCGRESGAGKAQLETAALLFRGPFRLDIPLAEIRGLSVQDGVLEVRFGRKVARFELGAAAVKWADRIQNPRSLLDKLGVKPESRVSVLGLRDPAFLADLAARGARVARGRLLRNSDLIFLAIRSPSDLNRFPALRASLHPAGAVWAVWPKGKDQLVGQLEVMVACRLARLVDTKAVSFSDTHTALKMVIPLEERE